LYKFKTHPLFVYSFKGKFVDIGLDLTSEWTVRNSGDPDNTYNQLISEKSRFPDEIDVFTDGFRLGEDTVDLVGCAIFSLCPN